jgi:3-phenylpropionate/trans-cinnamate dioxygenase ferredoxin subunit
MGRVVVVARADEIGPGERKLVTVGGRSIGVFNIDGEYHALRSRCPHQGGPLCAGFQFAPVRAQAPGEPYTRGRDGEIIRCPWHGWEFEIRTGRSWFDPARTRVRSYPARVLAETGLEHATERDGAAATEADDAVATGAGGAVATGADGAAASELHAETYPARQDGDYVVVELDR